MKIYRLILFFILLVLVSVLFYAITFNRFTTVQSNMDFSDFIKKYSSSTKVFRKPEGLQYKGKPILLYGCSFAYGEKLKQKDTFSAQLSKYIKRPVYNFAIKGHCIQHSLFLVRSEEHYKGFSEPEYVIYTYIPAHINRIMHTNYFGNTAYLQYRVKNNHLVQINSPFKYWHPTVLHNIWTEIKYDKYFDKDKKKRHMLLKLYFQELRTAFHKKYPKSKFVILLYDYEPIDMNLMWNELVKEGFIVYKISELAGIDPCDDKYKNPPEVDMWRHPNRQAWEKIVPALSSELNLK